jgi:hypothetical protein
MADGTGPSHLNMHACEPQLAGALHACIAAPLAFFIFLYELKSAP